MRNLKSFCLVLENTEDATIASSHHDVAFGDYNLITRLDSRSVDCLLCLPRFWAVDHSEPVAKAG